MKTYLSCYTAVKQYIEGQPTLSNHSANVRLFRPQDKELVNIIESNACFIGMVLETHRVEDTFRNELIILVRFNHCEYNLINFLTTYPKTIVFFFQCDAISDSLLPRLIEHLAKYVPEYANELLNDDKIRAKLKSDHVISIVRANPNCAYVLLNDERICYAICNQWGELLELAEEASNNTMLTDWIKKIIGHPKLIETAEHLVSDLFKLIKQRAFLVNIVIGNSELTARIRRSYGIVKFIEDLSHQQEGVDYIKQLVNDPIVRKDIHSQNISDIIAIIEAVPSCADILLEDVEVRSRIDRGYQVARIIKVAPHWADVLLSNPNLIIPGKSVPRILESITDSTMNQQWTNQLLENPEVVRQINSRGENFKLSLKREIIGVIIEDETKLKWTKRLLGDFNYHRLNIESGWDIAFIISLWRDRFEELLNNEEVQAKIKYLSGLLKIIGALPKEIAPIWAKKLFLLRQGCLMVVWNTIVENEDVLVEIIEAYPWCANEFFEREAPQVIFDDSQLLSIFKASPEFAKQSFVYNRLIRSSLKNSVTRSYDIARILEGAPDKETAKRWANQMLSDNDLSDRCYDIFPSVLQVLPELAIRVLKDPRLNEKNNRVKMLERVDRCFEPYLLESHLTYRKTASDEMHDIEIHNIQVRNERLMHALLIQSNWLLSQLKDSTMRATITQSLFIEKIISYIPHFANILLSDARLSKLMYFRVLIDYLPILNSQLKKKLFKDELLHRELILLNGSQLAKVLYYLPHYRDKVFQFGYKVTKMQDVALFLASANSMDEVRMILQHVRLPSNHIEAYELLDALERLNAPMAFFVHAQCLVDEQLTCFPSLVRSVASIELANLTADIEQFEQTCCQSRYEERFLARHQLAAQSLWRAASYQVDNDDITEHSMLMLDALRRCRMQSNLLRLYCNLYLMSLAGTSLFGILAETHSQFMQNHDVLDFSFTYFIKPPKFYPLRQPDEEKGSSIQLSITRESN